MNKILLVAGLLLLFMNGLQAQQIVEKEGRYYRSNEPFTGTYTTRFDNGQPKMEINIKNGDKHGKTKIWSADESLHEIRSYKNNQMHGKWEMFNKDNILVSVARYRNGQKHGKWMIWNDQGNLLYELHYRNGEKTGIWKSYEGNGNMVDKRKY